MIEPWLYKRFRAMPIVHGVGMLQYMKERFPDKDIHHVIGSMSRSMKLNDYLLVPLSREEHIWAGQHPQEAFEKYIFDALNYLFQYTQYLEGKQLPF